MNETDRTQPSAISLSSNYDGNPNGFPNVILHYPQKNRKYTQVMCLGCEMCFTENFAKLVRDHT